MYISSTAGMRKANVFPLPVLAAPIKSLTIQSEYDVVWQSSILHKNYMWVPGVNRGSKYQLSHKQWMNVQVSTPSPVGCGKTS